MKKGAKITCIALGVVLVPLLATAGLVSWALFSSSGLKKTIYYAIDNYAPCRIDVGNIRFDAVKTFPDLGLYMNDVVIFNQPGTAPYDTLARFGNLVLQVDADAYRHENTLKVKMISLNDISTWLYTDAEGHSNLDMFTGSDTKEKKDIPLTFTLPDSLNTKLTFDLQLLKLENANITYVDNKEGVSAVVNGIRLNAIGHINPSLKGNANISIDIADADCSIGDTAIYSFLAEGIGLKVLLNFDNPSVSGNGKLSLRQANMTSGELNALLDAFSLDFEAGGDTKNKMADSDVRISSGKLSVSSEEMKADVTSLNLAVKADGKYTFEDLVNATLSGSAKAVRVYLSEENPLAAQLYGIAINGSTAAKPSTAEGDAKFYLATDSMKFTMQGESSLELLSDKLSLNLSCFKDNVAIFCKPEIYAKSVLLALNGEDYISNWPVKTVLPITTDTAFNRLSIKNGEISLNRQDIGLSVDCSLAQDRVDAFGSVSFSSLEIENLLSMLPSGLSKSIDGIKASGLLSVDASARFSSDNGTFNIHKLSAKVKANDFTGNVNDSILASADNLNLELSYPGRGSKATVHTYDAIVTADGVKADIVADNLINADLQSLTVSASLDNITDKHAVERAITAKIRTKDLSGSFDTIQAHTGNLDIDGRYILSSADKWREGIGLKLGFDTISADVGNLMSVYAGASNIDVTAKIDTSAHDFLLRWNPDLNVVMSNTNLDKLPISVSAPELAFNFSLGEFNISKSRILLGNSDITLNGKVSNIGTFLREEGSMEGKLDFNSDYSDMDELMSMISGLGREDTIRAKRAQQFADIDNIQQHAVAEQVEHDSLEASPFIVPERINIVLNTFIKEMKFNNHSFHNLGGGITLNEGSLVMEELGFSSDAAEMQLTAIYRTPRPDHIYTGLDFHLLNIKIDELIDLIPSVDSIIPMLKSFDGRAQFHLAAETYLNQFYTPKMPTLIGAAAIEGKDLVVMDNEVFDGIKRKLLMSKKAENKIDSLSVELQVLRNKVDLYPFLIHMDRYTAAVSGRHNINKSLDCSYHISIIETPLPIRLGINIEGPLSDIALKPLRHIKLTKCKYDKTFVPEQMNATDQRIIEMKRVISETLKSNVR